MIKKTFPNTYDKSFVRGAYDLWLKRLFLEGVVFFSFSLEYNTFWEKNVELKIKSLLNCFSFLPFVDFIYGSVEETKKDYFKINCVIGFRIHPSCLFYVESKITETLVSLNEKFKLMFLKDFTSVLNAIQYLSKDFNRIHKYNIGFLGLYSPVLESLHSDTIISSVLDCDADYFKTNPYLYANQSITRYKIDVKRFSISIGSFSNVRTIPNSVYKKEYSILIYYLLVYYQISNISAEINENLLLKPESCLIFSVDLDNLHDVIVSDFLNILFELKKKTFPFINILELSIIFAEHSNQITSQVIFLLKLYKQYKN